VKRGIIDAVAFDSEEIRVNAFGLGKIFPVRECKPVLKEVSYEDGFIWLILCTMVRFHATASLAVILYAMAWSWEAAGYL
jgi:hypothetical protein